MYCHLVRLTGNGLWPGNLATKLVATWSGQLDIRWDQVKLRGNSSTPIKKKFLAWQQSARQ
jgi:hypothetical protein